MESLPTVMIFFSWMTKIAALCFWALMENVMLFLASFPDGMVHRLSTGVTI